MQQTKTILVVSPHPDDETIGAGATLLTLRAAGYRIVNLAISLGSAGQEDRRRQELAEACARNGFELIVPDEPFGISRGDDHRAALSNISQLVRDTFSELVPEIVVAPSVHDGHHGHETVARATVNALENIEGSRLWLWNIWGELSFPHLYVPFDDDVLASIHHSLDAYTGETSRNDLHRFVTGRATMAPALGSEKIFGFGSAMAAPAPYAELLTELVRQNGHWFGGTKRLLQPDNVCVTPSKDDLTFWVDSPSPRERFMQAQAREH